MEEEEKLREMQRLLERKNSEAEKRLPWARLGKGLNSKTQTTSAQEPQRKKLKKTPAASMERSKAALAPAAHSRSRPPFSRPPPALPPPSAPLLAPQH